MSKVVGVLYAELVVYYVMIFRLEIYFVWNCVFNKGDIYELILTVPNEIHHILKFCWKKLERYLKNLQIVAFSL